jgi:AcrR family transcriptional regulator
MTGIAARKERERQAREELILEHAKRLLVRDGYQNLNLNELAEAIEYSKGTIYLHFATKEDLALAVATKAAARRGDLFERAAQFTGPTRERARAIGFACVQFAIDHPDYFKIDIMLKSASFWEKASEQRQRAHRQQEARSFHIINNIVQEALRCGDLPASSPRAEHITFSLFAITIGSHCTAADPDLQALCAVDDPIRMMRRNQDILCDGLGWKPLSSNTDPSAVDRRIQKEIFPEANWLKSETCKYLTAKNTKNT